MGKIYWAGVFLGLFLLSVGVSTAWGGYLPEWFFNSSLVAEGCCVFAYPVWGILRPASYGSPLWSALRGAILIFTIFWFVAMDSRTDVDEAWILFLVVPVLLMMVFFFLCLLENLRARRRLRPHRLATILSILYLLLAFGWPLFLCLTALPYQLAWYNTGALVAYQGLVIGIMGGILVPLAGLLEIIKAIRYGRDGNGRLLAAFRQPSAEDD